MTLTEYLESKNQTAAEFARTVSITEAALSRYRRGRVPAPEVMRRIIAATGGEVQPNDFYQLPPPQTERAEA